MSKSDRGEEHEIAQLENVQLEDLVVLDFFASSAILTILLVANNY